MSGGAGSSKEVASGSKEVTVGNKKREPTEQEKERLMKEFVLITKTDTEVANYFLSEHDFDIQKAVPDYYSVAGEIMKEDTAGKLKALKSEPWVRELKPDVEVTGTFSFITWNVDGLDERELPKRTENLIDIILEEQPDVLFLQEVVHHSLGRILMRLKQYHIISQNSPFMENYFIVTLLKQDTVKILSQKQEQYSNTVMGRGVVSVEVEISGVKLWLHNTHLESTADFKESRVQQLKTIFSKLTQHSQTHSSIAAGDLNLRDAEVGLAGGIPTNCVDAWEACDRREECRYTWDTVRNHNCLSKGGPPQGNFKPRLRFDRVYLHTCKNTSKAIPVPKYFKLLGVTRVPHRQCYTSDHWAVQVFFTFNK